jgi:hypothetical protein
MLASVTFAALFTGYVFTMALLGSAKRSPAQPVQSERTQVRAEVGAESDLEVPLVEVISRAEGVSFRIGSREADSPAELQRLLQPLARLGSSISVRISHEKPFAHSADAITACRDAGFTKVLLVPAEPAP